MAVDGEGAKHLNLLHGSPDFALTQKPDGSFAVSNPDQIAPKSGVVWIAAETTFANDQTVPSVVVLDTDARGRVLSHFIRIDDAWLDPATPEDRGEVIGALELGDRDLFPYVWASHIPMASAGFD